MAIIRRLIPLGMRGLAEISSWIALLVTLLVTLDVALRYIFRASIPASVEFTQVLLVLMVYLALGKSQVDKQHIRVEFLIDKIPAAARRYWEAVVHLFALAFILIVFWESIGLFQYSYAMKEYYGGAVRVPIYPARGAILIGCGFMMIQLIKDIVVLLIPKGQPVSMPSPEKKEIEEAIQKAEEE